MQVRLLSKTTGATGTEYENRTIDEIIVGIARISSTRDVNELFDESYKLLRHCLLNGHWSIFEMANMTFEIKTSRAMGRELLRHGKLVGLQEYSQRYAPSTDFEAVEVRKQSRNNRQSSTDTFDPVIDYEAQYTASEAIHDHITLSELLYKDLLKEDVAREVARFVLPECTQTVLIMNFRIRELITFLNVRLHKTSQKEIRLIAQQIKDIFLTECPVISRGLYDFDNAENIHILDRLVLEKYKVYNLINQ
jgi:thymidylate synthase (FAD)